MQNWELRTLNIDTVRDISYFCMDSIALNLSAITPINL